MAKAKVLIIGSGGREHALAWKLKASPKIEKIFIAPGNAGTALVGENVGIQTSELEKLIDFAKKEKITLTVVGPDDALANGIVDAFQNQGLKIWGPSQKAAQVETSKSFGKELMARQKIPTADFKVFTEYQEARAYLKEKTAPIVIKASGLALGKGVAVCQNIAEAEKFLKEVMVEKIFGQAGQQVVIEEYLEGPEISIHAFCDGEQFHLLPSAQDHKPVFDNDTGPNTGGMGTIAPVPWVNQELLNETAQRVIIPCLKDLKKLNSPFIGLLYPGLKITPNGLKVLEFNARFGDPETQSYMRLLKTDLYDILTASVEGTLENIIIEWADQFACCIVLASGGYPGNYEKGKEITGVDKAEKMDDIVIFHAGTKRVNNQLLTNGGRVLGITATGETLRSALDKAYNAVKLIHFEGMHYRTDIGLKSLLNTEGAKY